ncbi:(2Fe-2S)-binding protein [Clostridiaceae bacterium 35-E11]
MQIEVNGIQYKQLINTKDTLLEVLREKIGLKGTKEGCGSGHCGACTVLLDGKPVNSCMLLGVQADNKKIMTIEGMAIEGRLHPIQEAFVEEHAVQCGFCTPGMVMSSKALLDKNAAPSDEEIREALSGNACRCTGYTKIIKAVKRAATKMHSEGEAR